MLKIEEWLAKIHNTKIEIIHSYIHALPIDKFKYNEDISISDLNESIEAKAKENMSLFVDKIVEQIKFGIIPPIKFNTHIVEGVLTDQQTSPRHPLYSFLILF